MRHLLLILFGALGCPNPPEEQQKDCIDHLAVLFMNGNKDEAVEAAEKVLKTGIKNEKQYYLNKSPLTIFSHAILATVQLNVRDAEMLFELAAKKFQKTGKMKEASFSYAAQGNCASYLGKFKESDQNLKMAKSLLVGIDKQDLSDLQKTISDYEVCRKNMLVLVESEDALKTKMALHSKEIATPIGLQYEILNFFGSDNMSTGRFKEANLFFSNAMNLIEEGLVIPEDARKEIQKNLEKVRLKLKDEKAP